MPPGPSERGSPRRRAGSAWGQSSALPPRRKRAWPQRLSTDRPAVVQPDADLAGRAGSPSTFEHAAESDGSTTGAVAVVERRCPQASSTTLSSVVEYGADFGGRAASASERVETSRGGVSIRSGARAPFLLDQRTSGGRARRCPQWSSSMPSVVERQPVFGGRVA